MGAVLVGYALLVPVAVLLLMSGGSGSFDGAFAVAVPMWLAAHQIPVEVDGRALGVLPLLPTAVVVTVVAVAANWSVRRLGCRIRHDAGPVVASQAGAAAAVAVLAGALLPGDVSVTTPWASMVGAGLLAGLAAGVGVLRACGLPPEWSRRLDGWPRAASSGARIGAAGLLLSGTLVLLLGLAVRAGTVAGSFAGLAPGVGESLGALLLAVGYLPNALVAGTAWSLGPGVAIGAAQYGPFDVQAGPLPPFPLFAAVPTEAVPLWGALVLLLPVGAGVAVGLVCRRALGATAPVRDRASAAGSAAGATAVGAGIVAAVAGGSLAGGPYDPVSLSPVGVLLAALVLLGIPATIAAVGIDELLGRRPQATRGSAAERAAARREGRSRDDARSTGSDRRTGPARRERSTPERGTSRDRSRTTSGDETGIRDDPAGEDREAPARDRPSRPSSDGPSRPRKRDAATPNGSSPGGTGRGPSSRTEREPGPRPRTVGDLVAQKDREHADDPPDPAPEQTDTGRDEEDDAER
ncbi:hypothetical protein EV378_4380 [Pseudonocardia endophytica]|uniref:Uncharacterized protein n=2 Tax=Pseudonocardia endophytica TaxID=401976 RepID=A0A4R1HHP8_PSEEN|nr:hypothetical protein EV378_4380 [Pseudonocardia endophytica]